MSRLIVETLDFLEGMFASKCGKGAYFFLILTSQTLWMPKSKTNRFYFGKHVEIVLPLDISSRQKSGNIPRG